MRHKVAGKKFNRDTNHRRSMLKNLVMSLISHEHLVTTEAKSKVVLKHTEKIIQKGKIGSVHARRQIISELFNKKDVANKVVDVLAPRFMDKTGGFITTERLGCRKGDNVMLTRLTIISGAKDAQQPVVTK